MQSFHAHYFDGKSSVPKSVTLELHENFVRIAELNLAYEFKDIEVRAKLKNTPQSVSFSDGSYCELGAEDFFFINNQDKLLLTLESKIKYAALSFAVLCLFVVLCLTYGTTMAANIIAPQVPKSVVNGMSERALEVLDDYYMSDSKLDKTKRLSIQKRFDAVLNKNSDLKLHFRSSSIFGANAFALPSGDIVLLDGLVELEKDEEFRGIIGVLAHEQGHVVHMHGVKMLIKSSISSALIGYLTGDFSGFVTSFSTLMVEAKYSRTHETEADLYAIKVLRENNISTKYMADLFDELAKEHESSDNTTLKSILSSHPAIEERIKQFRK